MMMNGHLHSLRWLLPLACLAPALAVEPQWPVLWEQPLGQGFSAPAKAGESLFVTYRKERSSETTLRAVELETGELRWERSFADAPHVSQENYGGGNGPHATPLVHDGVVIVVGFAGGVRAFEAETGQPLWGIDLVEELGATPVQFGFAAQPVAHGDDVLLHVGGQAGFASLGLRSGDVKWTTPAAEPSYVTPRLLQIEGMLQLVGVTRDATQSVDPTSGAILWSLPHRKAKLTNYAMLLPCSRGGLLVSGQGTQGLQRIDVRKDGDQWTAEASWHVRSVQYSHGQVFERDGFAFGSNGSVLSCVDTRDGSLAFRQRAVGGEANLVRLQDDWVLRVEQGGQLELLRLRPEVIEVWARRATLQEKAWAPPCITEDGRVLVRDANQLVALALPDVEQGEPLETIETGYEADQVTVAPAAVAFAHGEFQAKSGERLWLRAQDGVLSARTAEDSAWITLAARSEREFEAARWGRLELQEFGGAQARGLTWNTTQGTVNYERVAAAPMDLGAARREELLGPWKVAGQIDLQLHLEGGALRATSSQYDGVTFGVRAETSERLWFEALDAPYGIPPILADFTSLPAKVHQGPDSYPLTRP